MRRLDSPKRKAILDAARCAFIAHGYSGTSMETIADLTPVSKATVYKYFQSKANLFAEVIQSQASTLLNTLQRLQTQASEPPAAGLTRIGFAFVDIIYTPDALQLYRLIIAEQQQFPELGELIYRAGPEPVIRCMSNYLRDLSDRGVLMVSNSETSARLFLDTLKGDRHFRCLLGLENGLSPETKQQLVTTAVDFFLKGHAYDS